MQGVGAFHRDDAEIGAKFPSKRAVASINRVDPSGTRLQEAVRESAHIRAEIGARQPGGIHAELIERVPQLQATAPDVGGKGHQLEDKSRPRRGSTYRCPMLRAILEWIRQHGPALTWVAAASL